MSMSNHHDQNPGIVSTTEKNTAFMPPPPAGYPTKDEDVQVPASAPATQVRGDGFCRGCCAGLCCCCLLDACF